MSETHHVLGPGGRMVDVTSALQQQLNEAYDLHARLQLVEDILDDDDTSLEEKDRKLAAIYNKTEAKPSEEEE